MSSAPLSPGTITRFVPPSDNAGAYDVCCETIDRAPWHPDVRQFFDYWLKIKPPGLLPGRQHFDVLDIPTLMQRVWLLDVLREPLRYRYRLAGTKEVEAVGREMTGQMFDEARKPSPGRDRTRARFDAMVAQRMATYRKGFIGLEHDKSRHQVENCMVPFAQDGVTVDMIGVLSVVFNSIGRPI